MNYKTLVTDHKLIYYYYIIKESALIKRCSLNANILWLKCVILLKWRDKLLLILVVMATKTKSKI